MAPCSWDIDPKALGCCDFETWPDTVKATALALATSFMWGATGRRYGPCQFTVRPCQPKRRVPGFTGYVAYPTSGSSAPLAVPYVDRTGTWRNGCGCGPACCCKPACEVQLEGPVASVAEVVVDGEVVPSSAYRVDMVGGEWWLVRTDGHCWPNCQNLNANTGEGVFEVTYGKGIAIPDALQQATGILACEFAKAAVGDSTCRLPGRLASLTRQGVTLEIDPPGNDEIGYITGIELVDQVIANLNPSRRKSPPMIYSPDMDTAGDRVTVIGVGA